MKELESFGITLVRDDSVGAGEVLVHPQLLQRVGARAFATLRVAPACCAAAPSEGPAVCLLAAPSSAACSAADDTVARVHPWVIAAIAPGARDTATPIDCSATVLEPSSGAFACVSRVRAEIVRRPASLDCSSQWQRDLVAAALMRQCSARTLARGALLPAVIGSDVVVFRVTSLRGDAPPPTEAEKARAVLTAIWSTHAPEKLPTIDAVLLKYAGREAVMVAALKRKYSDAPPPTEAQKARAVLTAIWSTHAPEKLPTLDAVLRKYAGREAVMVAALRRKYGESRGASAAPAAACSDVDVFAGVSNWSTRYEVCELRSSLPPWMEVWDRDDVAMRGDAAETASLAPSAEVREAVDLLSWSLHHSGAGRAVAFGALVEGAAGAGKTTTLRAIAAAIATRCDARIVALHSLRLALAHADEVAARAAAPSAPSHRSRNAATSCIAALDVALRTLGRAERTVVVIDDADDLAIEPAVVVAIATWLRARPTRVCVVCAGVATRLRSGSALASHAGVVRFAELFDVGVDLGSGSSVAARRRVLAQLARRSAGATSSERDAWVEGALRCTKGRSAKGVAALYRAAEFAALGSRPCSSGADASAPPPLPRLDVVGRVCVARAAGVASKPATSRATSAPARVAGAAGAARAAGWSRVGGLAAVKARLIQLVQWQWEQPDAVARMGIARTSGILLHGPSGGGKTLIASALSAECAVNFIEVNSAGLFSQYLGDSERNLRDVFRDARNKAPCILFFDEVDCIAARRDGEDAAADGGGVGNRLLSTLLNEMDGVDSDRSADEGSIVVLGATNRPDAIDAALMRPGRFDQVLFVGPPTTAAEQLAILRIHTAHIALDPAIDLADLAERFTEGLSGSDIQAACSEAAMEALRDDLEASAVKAVHFERAFAR